MSEIQKEKFKKLVNFAESYIIENAEKVLLAVRDEKLSETNTHEHCQKLLEKYKPIYGLGVDEIPVDDFKKILNEFCRELQNYQAMPKAINYLSFSVDKDNNEILNCIYEFFSEKFNEIGINSNLLRELEGKFLDIKNKNSSDDEQSKELNKAWEKYSRGLMDVLIKIKGKSSDIDKAKEKFIESINKDCDYFNNVDGIIEEIEKDEAKKKDSDFNSEYNKYRDRLREFNKDIFGMGDTLTLDFFKELKCENLIKNDSHIIACYKHVGGKCNEKNKIVFEFISMCKKIEYTPFYVDKILWLCCTGNFDKDGIIITKMNRTKFFKEIEKSKILK